MSNNPEKSVGNPVVVIDLATGLVIQGVLSGVSQAGINKLTFMSVQVEPEAFQNNKQSFNSSYTRIGPLASIEIAAILK